MSIPAGQDPMSVIVKNILENVLRNILRRNILRIIHRNTCNVCDWIDLNHQEKLHSNHVLHIQNTLLKNERRCEVQNL